jgi:hypothetical protein
MSEQPEVNPLRDAIVKSILAQYAGEPITVENRAPHFPADFLLGDDDLAQYQQAAKETPPVKINGRMLDPEAAARHTAAEAEAVAKAAPDPAAIEAATLRRIKADQDLANRRVEVLAAQDAERVARDKLATAVTTFQKGFAPVTPEQLRRSHVAEQAEIRAAIKDGRLNPRRNPGIGKSVVDRIASYGRGGSPARGNYQRGAFGSHMKGAPNYDPRRGAVAAPPVTPQIVVK